MLHVNPRVWNNICCFSNKRWNRKTLRARGIAHVFREIFFENDGLNWSMADVTTFDPGRTNRAYMGTARIQSKTIRIVRSEPAETDDAGTTAFDQTRGYGKYRSKTLLLIVCTRFTAPDRLRIIVERSVINTFFRPTEKRLSDVWRSR